MANYTLSIPPSSSLDLPIHKSILLTLLGAVSLAATFRHKLFGKSTEAIALPNTSSGGDDDEDERSIRHYLSSKGHDGILFFGSQTGTAEDYARRLGKALQDTFDLSIGVADLEEFDMATLSYLTNFETNAGKPPLVGFVVATYGDGEPTDNAVAFSELLSDDSQQFSGSVHRDDLPLKGLNYLAFGLGNNTYEQYNFMVRKVKGCLDALGATRIGEAGEGDDGAGTMDEDFIRWKVSTLKVLETTLGFKKSEKQWTPSHVVTEEPDIDRLDPRVDLGDKTAVKHDDSKKTLGLTRVLSSKQLYSPHSRPQRECIHVEFDLHGTGLTYTTGDHVGLWPTNPEPEVDRLLRVLALDQQKDTVIVSSNTEKSTLGAPKDLSTYSVVLRHKMEICGVISRESLNTISNFAPTQDAKDLLLKLYNDKVYFNSFVTARCLNLGQLLEIASQRQTWMALPFAALYDFLPALQPRYYSISSSNAEYPQSLHITTAIKRDVIEPGVRNFYGVASNFLRALTRANDHVSEDTIDETTFELTNPRAQDNILSCAIFVRQSTFRLPPNPRTPILMIGPGTGVAPFRAFMQERVRLARKGTPVGRSVLYFGCRKQSEDFLYADDWETTKQVLNDNFLLRTAFSRDSSQKVYVQQRLIEDSHDIWKLLNAQGAWFYICGDAKHMAKDVREALMSVIVKEASLSEVDARKYIQNLKAAGRFHEDVW